MLCYIRRMKFYTITAAICLAALLSCNNSNVDQSLLGDMTSTAAQLEEFIGQSEIDGQQLQKFKAVVDRAPEAMRADTAMHFSAFADEFEELSGQHAAVNAQLNDMKIRLAVMTDDYAAGKLKTETVKAEFENFSSSMKNIGETISSFATGFGKAQTDFGKMMADFNMKKEEGETN